jgi:hypothetical protein
VAHSLPQKGESMAFHSFCVRAKTQDIAGKVALLFVHNRVSYSPWCNVNQHGYYATFKVTQGATQEQVVDLLSGFHVTNKKGYYIHVS